MKSSFNNLVETNQLVLLDFFADWCGPCQTLSPVLQELKAELGEMVKIVKVDVDKNQKLALQFNVRSVPALFLFKNGSEVWKHSGVMTKSDLIKAIKIQS